MLEVIISTFPTSGFEVSRDITLIKSILPYADKIKLYSPKSFMILGVISIALLTEKQKIELFSELIPHIDTSLTKDKILTIYNEIIALRKKKGKNKSDLLKLLKFESGFKKSLGKLEGVIENIFKESGFGELTSLVENNILSFEEMPLNSEAIASIMLQHFQEVFSDDKVYPLFDKDINSLVNSAIQEGVIKLENTYESKNKHMGIVNNLFDRLPALTFLSIEEILGIKQELGYALTRFRGSIQKFSNDIKNYSWDEKFSYEMEQLYIKEIAPAVAEIEETIKGNKYIHNFLRNSVNSTTILSLFPVIGVGVATDMNLEKLAYTALSPVAAITSNAVRAFYEIRDKREAIKKNHMYFYYELNQRLK